MYESGNQVNHPKHYQSETGMEVIDVIHAFTFNLTGIEAFDTGNILKYICRWKEKNGVQDLEKAKWYLELMDQQIFEKETDKVTKCYYVQLTTLFNIDEGYIQGVEDEIETSNELLIDCWESGETYEI